MSGDGSVIVASSDKYTSANATGSGALHVFRFDGSAFTLTESLQPPMGAASFFAFGMHVALSADGMYLASVHRHGQEIQVFRYDGGRFVGVGLAALPCPAASLAAETVITNDGTLVFSWAYCTVDGEAMVFKIMPSNVTAADTPIPLVQTIPFPGLSVYDTAYESAEFGHSLSISNDASTLLVGAANLHVGGHDGAGGAFVFTRSIGACC